MIEQNAADSAPPFWHRALIYVTIALMPLSANIEKLIGAKRPFSVDPLLFLLPILSVVLALNLFRKRPWVRFTTPPLTVVLWVGIAWLSVLWSEGFPSRETLSTWLRGLFNPVFFGLAAVWVFSNLSADAREYRRLALILCGSFAVCVLLALMQYVGPQGLPFDPDNPTKDLMGVTDIRLGGWYDYRAVFGAQAAMLIPVGVAFAVSEKDAALRVGAAAFSVLALCVTLAAGGFLGACAGALAIGAALLARRRYWPGIFVVLALLVTVAVVLPRLPRHNLQVLHRGMTLYADNESGERKPTARLRRYQASMSLLAAPTDPQNEHSSPKGLLGVGVGRYQKEVNAFYREPYPKPGRRTDDEIAYDMESDERYTFGFLETAAVETGVVGLAIVLLLFATWIFGAQGAYFRLSAPPSELDARATLALASLGAGVGALVVSVFASPILRGVGGTFAFFLALAFCCARWSDAESPKE
jgi:hypothetical protein